MADLVTRLLLDSKQFDNNIVKSSREVQQLQKVGKAMTSSLISGLRNIAGPLGIALTGMEAFSTAINANANLQYNWNAAMDGAKTSVNDFFIALSTGDWSKFRNGLLNSINDARVLAAELKTLQVVQGTEKEKADYYEGRKNSAEAMINAATTEQEANKALDEWFYYDVMEKASRKKAREAAELKPLKQAHSWGATGITSGTELFNLVTKYIPGTDDYDKLKAYAEKRLEKQKNKDYYLSLLGNPNTNADEREAWWLSVKERNQEIEYMSSSNPEMEKAYKLLPHLTEDYIKEIQENLAFLGEQHDKTGTADMAANAIIDTFNTAIEKIRKGEKGDINTKGTNYKPYKVGGTSDKYVKDLTTIAGVDAEIKRLEDERLTANQSQRKELDNQLEVLRLQKEVMDNNLEGTKEAVNMFMELAAKQSGLILSQEESNELDAYMNQTPDVKVKLEPYIDDTESTFERLFRERKELIEKFNKSTNKAERIKIKAEIDKKNDEIDKEKGKKKAEAFVESYSRTLANADFGSKKGRQAVARETVESIKALIIAKVIESTMALPFPANIIAAPPAAALVAGLFSLIPAFSTGGVFEGNSDYGDMNIARVNAGEMILNNRQQKNLFNLLNGGSIGTNGTSSQVEFKIRGKELVGVLDNYNNKVNRVR